MYKLRQLFSKKGFRSFSTSWRDNIKPFKPKDHGLKEEFRLTSFSKLKGWGCKIPQSQLFDYLKDIGDGTIGKETPDCSVTKYYHDQSISLVSTIDFFYPLVEDPYLQGRIGCANVLSDIYAMGIERVDHMLMVLAVSTEMDAKEREVITREMIKGFNDTAQEAGTKITGGQSVLGPWPIIGGVANTVVRFDEYLIPNQVREGNVIVLTKPLGTQVAVNLKEWKSVNNDRYKKAKEYMTDEEMERMYELAIHSMGRLNKFGARLVQKYKSNACTDVTGFGILGHLKNLAEAQHLKGMDLRIEALPIFKHAEWIENNIRNFSLIKGYSPETSGGLLAIMHEGHVNKFQSELANEYGEKSWVIGQVVASNDKTKNVATIKEHPEIIQVEEI